MTGTSVQVLRTVREGPFARSERLEDEGRIQSWVLAGERGAAELRGTGPDWLYLVVHAPVPSHHVSHSHLVLADASVFPSSRCTVLEGHCRVVVAGSFRSGGEIELSDPWRSLATTYRAYFQEAARG